MPRYSILPILALIVIVCAGPVHPEKSSDQEDGRLPPGMVLKKVGGSNVVVPDGSRIRQEGDLRIVEGTGEYAARKFIDIDAHFEKIDADLMTIRAEIEQLKKCLSEIQQNKLVSEDSAR